MPVGEGFAPAARDAALYERTSMAFSGSLGVCGQAKGADSGPANSAKTPTPVACAKRRSKTDRRPALDS